MLLCFWFIIQGIGACYEKSKSCLSSYSNASYDKQLYGWFGALQRQLQRSQYQIQYGRPNQTIFWVILVVVILGEFSFPFLPGFFSKIEVLLFKAVLLLILMAL